MKKKKVVQPQKGPKGQHYVPRSYLENFGDPKNKGKIYVFNKKGKLLRSQKPENLFKKNHLYTIKRGEKKDYTIETSLAELEGIYCNIFKNKIKEKLPLTQKEHIYLCAFIAVMFQRTLRHKDNLEKTHNELIEKSESMALYHGADPSTVKSIMQLKAMKDDLHKTSMIEQLPFLTDLLSQMGLAFLCADKSSSKYITSDDPCDLFNPDLQWQRFYSPGFGQKNVQVTMPLSPDITICFSWSNLRGYINLDKERIDNLNRMSRARCYKEFGSHQPKIKWIWLLKFPLDPIFILKIIVHWVKQKIFLIKTRHVRRRRKN